MVSDLVSSIMTWWILCLDLEELLHQLGVGQEGGTHSDRKRRSITGSPQKGARHPLDGCNHETGRLSQDWAQVRQRQMSERRVFCTEKHENIAANLLAGTARLDWKASYSPNNLSFPLNLIRCVSQPISWWIFLLWIHIYQFPRSTSDKFAQPSFSSC